MSGGPFDNPSGDRLSVGGGSLVIDANGDITYSGGEFIMPDGTEAVPSLKGTTSGVGSGDGIYFGDNIVGFSVNGAAVAAIDNGALVMRSDKSFGWDSADTPSEAGMDVKLYRAGAGQLALRDGTNAQQFRVYHTYTDDSNGEWLEIEGLSNLYRIEAASNGTGSLRNIRLGGAAQVHVSSTGLAFYNGTPITQQTGVAVTAAAIHAACVALNLFTA